MASSLRVIQSPPKVKHSRMSKRRAAVLIAVHLVIAGHIAHWLIAGRTVTPVEPSEAMAFAKGGMVNAGLIFFGAAILLTLVFGRFFCGWACHLVALQDLCRWLLEKLGHRPQPLRSRLLKFVPLVAFAYMFLWPVAYRLWIGDSFAHVETEWTTTEFWSTFPGWIVGGATLLVCGFAAVYFLGAKGFCTYACPYGAVFGAVERLSPLRIRVTDACEHCGHCTSVCTSNVRVHEEVATFGMVVDSGCMKCMDCVSVCPNDALYYGAGPLPLLTKARAPVPERRYPLTWREETFLAVAFAAAFFVFRGLYGAVPFLMALGLAGVLAYLVLVTTRLVARPAFAAKGVRLKIGGRLRPAGWTFVAGMVMLVLLWGQSAAVRATGFLGERAFAKTSRVRAAALDLTQPRAALTAAERAQVDRALGFLERAHDWGLLPSPGHTARRAWLYWLSGSQTDFAAAAQEALDRGEAPAEMAQLFGRDAWARRDPAAAAAAFERGLAAVPRSVDFAYNAALARALAGESEAAIRLFERALEIDPAHLPSRENLAGVLASAGRYREAVEHYRRALAINPEDAATRLLLARALAAAGDVTAARTEVEWSLQLAPGNEAAIILLRQLSTNPSIEPASGAEPDGLAQRDETAFE